AEMNGVVTGQIAGGLYDSFRYDVGVPFEDNHLDSASAPAPLNSPGMFWTWQGGYKFVRVDFAVDTVVRSRWNVHVGSGGCASAAPTTAPTEECALPNRATVRLDDIPLQGGRIEVELSELVATADLGKNTEESPPGCMSAPADGNDCSPTFAALGMSIDTGACVDNCNGQRLFDPIVPATAE
ncbi:MAG: putative repeat protein (TIGR04052 family), partial [Myxococcota bacterium]